MYVQERDLFPLGRRHGGGVAAERGGVRALGADRRPRGGAAGRVAAARQAARLARAAGHARRARRRAACARAAPARARARASARQHYTERGRGVA